MGFLFPKAPAPPTPPNPAHIAVAAQAPLAASGTGNSFLTSTSGTSSFLSAASPTLKKKDGTTKTTLIGGG